VERGRDEGCGKWVEPADLPTSHDDVTIPSSYRKLKKN